MKRITLDDVARLAGVSPITVSRALRNPQSVSGKLKERIDKAVAELGYVPNLAASRLASSRSHAIGVIVPTLYNIIFADYLMALHEVLVDAGFQVVVVNSRYSEIEEENAVKALIGQRVEAIILAGVRHTPLARQLLKQARMPVVETLELTDDPIDFNIGLSQEDAGHAATIHLVERGFRRISFMTGNFDPRAKSRHAGYLRAIEQAGLSPQASISPEPRQSSIALGTQLGRALLEASDPPEALFCTDDNLALGAAQACLDKGIRVPDDMAIIGFHDLEFAAYASPSLSTVATRRYETGRLAAEKVIAALSGSPRGESCRIDTGFAVVARESTMGRGWTGSEASAPLTLGAS